MSNILMFLALVCWYPGGVLSLARRGWRSLTGRRSVHSSSTSAARTSESENICANSVSRKLKQRHISALREQWMGLGRVRCLELMEGLDAKVLTAPFYEGEHTLEFCKVRAYWTKQVLLRNGQRHRNARIECELKVNLCTVKRVMNIVGWCLWVASVLYPHFFNALVRVEK